MRHISKEVTVKTVILSFSHSHWVSAKASAASVSQLLSQEAFPSPILLNPSLSGGLQREHSMQMLTFHNKSYAHIRLEWSLLQPIAACSEWQQTAGNKTQLFYRAVHFRHHWR